MFFKRLICANELRAFLLGTVRGSAVVVLAYLGVHYAFTASGTLSLVEGADTFTCMLIFGLAYSVAVGRLAQLRISSKAVEVPPVTESNRRISPK